MKLNNFNKNGFGFSSVLNTNLSFIFSSLSSAMLFDTVVASMICKPLWRNVSASVVKLADSIVPSFISKLEL